MAKLHFYRERVANMLEKLYFVSHYFTLEEYEMFVAATHTYLTLVQDDSLLVSEFNSLKKLAHLVDKYQDDLKEYYINTNFITNEDEPTLL